MALPVNCDLDTQCYIQQFMDHDPSSGASDMRCGPLTYDGHTGTDFAIRDPLANPNGVNVIASAAGTIKALRDGVPDIVYTPARASELDGKECGNGVVIAHDQGWETQYCHLKQGSISVKVGDTVQVSDFLTTCRKSKRCALVAKLHHLPTKVPQLSSPPLDLVYKKVIS
jgi:hypothetical protein